MPIKDQIKNYATKLVERRPDQSELYDMLRDRKPAKANFEDDGIVPNNRRWPLIMYRGAVGFTSKYDAATIMDTLFETNGWGRSWRDSVYDFVHYHSQVHEVLGVARGTGNVEFGGVKGRVIALRAGDVVILPAGTGHRLIDASKTFLVVGAYPAEGTYDECTDTRDRPEAVKRIARVKKPKTDPVFGNKGPLLSAWSGRRQ
ncbi:MAG: cupin domain-containing protein [Acidobacteria bacterium]|nr:cupin domain-containing protein [Acidobacteriota bacterium]